MIKSLELLLVAISGLALVYPTVVNSASPQTVIAKPSGYYYFSPDTMFVGESTTLKWDVQNATSCKNQWGTEIGVSGNLSTRPPAGIFLYKLTCIGQGGSTTFESLRTVKNHPQPTANFYYSRDNVLIGESVTLLWSSTDATSCTNRWGTEIGTSGCYTTVQNSAGTFNPTFTCSGPGGSIDDSASYTVDLHPNVAVLAQEVQNLNPAAWPANINCSTPINNGTEHVCNVTEMYNAWIGIDGILDLYLATGDVFLVETALAVGEKYQSIGKDENGDTYLDWFSLRLYRHNRNKYDHNHYEWRAGAGVARIISVILSDARLRYLHPRAKKLMAFAEQHIWTKWYNKSGQFSNLQVTHFIGRVGIIALNLYKHTTNPTLKAQYLAFIQNRGRVLKNSLVTNMKTVDGVRAYNIRCYADGRDCNDRRNSNDGTIDVSHAGDTVAFVVEAYLAGGFGVFHSTDIDRLANSVLKLIISPTDSKFRSNVCSINACTSHPPDNLYYGRIGTVQSEWAKLARFNSQLLDVYLYWLSNYINVSPAQTPSIQIHQTPRVGYITTGLYGNLALAITRMQ